MGCGACLAKGTVCGTGDCDGHGADASSAVLGVIRQFSKGRSSNSFNPFQTVRAKNPIPAFSRGAGAVGGTGTGQFNYAGSVDDPTKSVPDSSSGSSSLSAIPGLVDATANALSTVITAANRTNQPMTSSTSQSLTAAPGSTVPTTASAPLGVPIPYWIGAAAVVGGAFWWASRKGRRR